MLTSCSFYLPILFVVRTKWVDLWFLGIWMRLRVVSMPSCRPLLVRYADFELSFYLENSTCLEHYNVSQNDHVERSFKVDITTYFE